MGAAGTLTVTLNPAPTTLAQARDGLQAAIRAASAKDAFAMAIVASVDECFVVMPGAAVAPVFSGTPGDQTTYRELGLESDRYAIAGDDIGQLPGPPTSVWRSTILGPCHVQSLNLASDTIFTAPATADRRQTGCVRFSYVAPGSAVPRRYRCQPDLALDGITDHVQRAAIKARLVPSFTSVQYGQPGYGQLAQQVGDEIFEGADDGNEMGAFNFLKQAQRKENLSAALEEYLRFGLELGFFFVT
jgi:hypothetical protein